MKKCMICGGEGFYSPSSVIVPGGQIDFPYEIDLCPTCFFDDHRISCAARLSAAMAERVAGLDPEQAEIMLKGGVE